MKVRLNCDQRYINVMGGIYFGKKGEVIDVDVLFARHIQGKYTPVKDEVEKPESDEKPLEKMNKAELIAKALKEVKDVRKMTLKL